MRAYRLALLFALELVVARPYESRHRPRAVDPTNIVSVNGPADFWYALSHVLSTLAESENTELQLDRAKVSD